MFLKYIKVHPNLTMRQKGLMINNWTRYYMKKKLQNEGKFVRTCATMPDHVASASMWPHFPDEAIIILIILVIMAFQEITIHHPLPGQKMMIKYDICLEFYTTTIIRGNLTRKKCVHA